MKRLIYLFFTFLILTNFVSCTKNDIGYKFAPPVAGIQWGMKPDEVIEILKLSEDNILENNEKIVTIEYDDAVVFGQKANIFMSFDIQTGIGLSSMDVYFPYMDKDALTEELNNAYGKYIAVDDKQIAYQWESETIKELPKKIQERFQYTKIELPTQIGIYDSSSFDSIWEVIQNQPLVIVSLGDNTLFYTADNMAGYVLFSNDKEYDKLLEYLNEFPKLSGSRIP